MSAVSAVELLCRACWGRWLGTRTHRWVIASQPLPPGLIVPACKAGAMNSPARLSACCVIPYLFEEECHRSIGPRHGRGPRGSSPGRHLGAPVDGLIELADRRPTSRTPCPQVRACFTWVPSSMYPKCRSTSFPPHVACFSP